MDMREFFTLLYSEEGYKFIVVNAKKHLAATSIDHMVELVEANDTGSNDVFHSCASYVKPEYKDEDGKTHWREQENVLSAKAFWLDMDCGQKWKDGQPKVGKDGDPVMGDYASQSEALVALKNFCKATGLPVPMIVSSGYGIHAYWLLTEALAADKWMKVANLWRKVLLQEKMPFDPARDKDAASILRPVGSHNRKNPKDPKVVQCIRRMAEPLAPAQFINLLVAAKREDAPPQAKKKASAKNASFISVSEMPDVPKYADVVADKCAQLAHFRETGSLDYTNWWNGVGVLKHCVDGEKIIHMWSKKNPDYDSRETQFKIDEWKKGPTTCEKFVNFAKLCDNCPSRGKVKSPITLGYVMPETQTLSVEDDDDEVEAKAEADDDEAKAEPTVEELVIPKPFQAYNDQLVFMKKDEDGDITPIPLTNVVFAPCARFALNGEQVVSFKARIRKSESGKWEWKSFNINASLCGSGGIELRKELAKYEIYALPGSKNHLELYVSITADDLRRRAKEINSRLSMGWQDDGSFIAGQRCVTADGEKPMVVSGKNVGVVLGAFKNLNGSAGKWTEAIMELYDRPEHEQFQYVLYMGFGSVLMELWGNEVGSNFVNLYGKASAGKSSAILSALSIYGNPGELLKSFKTGITANAMYSTLSALKSMPLGLDEVTNIAPAELSDLAYGLSSGRPKSRVNTKGEIVVQGDNFKNTTFGASNSSMNSKLSALKDDAFAEMSRIIEINWRSGLDLCPTERARELFRVIQENAGTAAIPFIQYVTANREAIYKLMVQTRARIDRDVNLSTDYRFWSAQHAAGMTAGIVATKLGLLNFKVGAVYNFVQRLILDNRTELSGHVVSPDDSFNAMVNAISNNIIVTRDEKDAREGSVDSVVVTGEPLGRAIRDKWILYIAVSAVRDWCHKRQIDYHAMRKAMEDKHVLLEHNKTYSLGKGTSRPTAPTRVWKLDMQALQGVVTEKIVPLQVVNS